MTSVFLAMGRALLSLIRPGILWHLLWPALLATLVWLLAGAFFIDDLAALLRGWLPAIPLIGRWFADASSFASGAAGGLITLMLWITTLPLIYVTALLIVATSALPLMLERVGEREYPDLERRGGGSQWGSFAVSLRAALLFLLLLALSLPLWLIPGVGLAITLLLSARLNRVCFAYDALMHHADAIELARLPREHAERLNLLAAIGGVMSLVPLLNLFAPALSGLSFAHYLLAALRHERARPMHDIGPAVAGQVELLP